GVELRQIDDEDQPQQQRTGAASRLEDTADSAALVLLIDRESSRLGRFRQTRVDATKQVPYTVVIRAAAHKKLEGLGQPKEQNQGQNERRQGSDPEQREPAVDGKQRGGGNAGGDEAEREPAIEQEHETRPQTFRAVFAGQRDSEYSPKRLRASFVL